MKKRTGKAVKNCDDQQDNRFSKRIRDLSKQAEDLGFSDFDFDFLDQIPDNEIVDEPIPFPYGGGRKFDIWNLK